MDGLGICCKDDPHLRSFGIAKEHFNRCAKFLWQTFGLLQR